MRFRLNLRSLQCNGDGEDGTKHVDTTINNNKISTARIKIMMNAPTYQDQGRRSMPWRRGEL